MALHEVFLGTIEMPQESFLTRLAEALPILDGGRYRLAVQSQIAYPWHTPRPNQVSPCLSAALLSLEASGVIRMEARSDAPQRVLLGRSARELRTVSHFAYVGAA
jgi:hypothetical protein